MRVQTHQGHSHECPRLCAGLLGDGALYLLEMVKRKVAQPTARVIPAAATMYCMGVEAVTPPVLGFDMSPLDQYRCDAASAGSSVAVSQVQQVAALTLSLWLHMQGSVFARKHVQMQVLERSLCAHQLGLRSSEHLSNRPRKPAYTAWWPTLKVKLFAGGTQRQQQSSLTGFPTSASPSQPR